MSIFKKLCDLVTDLSVGAANSCYEDWFFTLEDMGEGANQDELAAISVLQASLQKYADKYLKSY